MENLRGILSNSGRSSRRNSTHTTPNRSRASSRELRQRDNDLDTDVIIHADDNTPAINMANTNTYDQQLNVNPPQHEAQQSCRNCNIQHPYGPCNLSQQAEDRAPSAPPPPPSFLPSQPPTEQRMQEENVRKIAKLSDVLNSSNSFVDGDQVSQLVTNLCDNIFNSKVAQVQKQFDEAHEKLKRNHNEMQTELEDIKNRETYDPCTPYQSSISFIPIPSCLKKGEIRDQNASLDYLYKVERIFKNVPMFTDKPGGVQIRDFLHSISSIANNCPSEITEEEYMQVLWNKLSPSIQKILANSREVTDAQSLHRALLTFFDLSETPTEAMSKLQQLKPTDKMNTVQKFLNEALRLVDLLQGSAEEKAKVFGIAAKGFIPERLKRRLEDEFVKHTTLAGREPSLIYLMNFIKSYKTEIDEANEKLSRRLVKQVHVPEKKYAKQAASQNGGGLNANAGNGGGASFPRPNGNAPKGNGKFCTQCGAKGHEVADCWKNSMCSRCGKMGHIGKVCRAKCNLCGMQGHSSITCHVYPGQMPMSSSCSTCKRVYDTDLYHNEDSCLLNQKN